jgi:hypothetical protein
MAWRRGYNHQALADLSSLTARLVRLAAFQQLQRGQLQLNTLGLNTNFLETYADFARTEPLKLQPSQDNGLLIVTTKGKAF